MHPSDNPAIAAQVARLHEAYMKSLPEKLSALRHAAAPLVANQWTLERAREVHHLAHKLAGGAGTFGLAAVSNAARALELSLMPFLDDTAEASQSLSAIVASHLSELLHVAARPVEAHEVVIRPLPAVKQAPNWNNLIYIVDDDPALGRIVSANLRHRGYEAELFTSVEAFMDMCDDTRRPAAVVMDIRLGTSAEAGFHAITRMRERCGGSIPVVFVSARDDIETRLKALRLGARRYLAKPFEMDKLERVLDDLTLRLPGESFRVLLVDDDVEVLAHTRAALESVGMKVQAISDPLRAIEVVKLFRPDVLLLDVYMPQCSGLELAAVLREDDSHAHLPILFLSTETDFRRQLVSPDLGGDDFLTKPVDPERLVAATVARAKRSRYLREVNEDLRRVLRERDNRQLALDQHAIVSITNANGDILYVNDKFCEISGYNAAELIGNNHRIIKSGEHPPEFYQELWATISAGEVWQGVVCNRRKDGSHYWVESTIAPVADERGVPYEYVSVRTDITQLKLTEQALSEREERLRRSQYYANIGTWDWNIQTGALYWSERIAPLFGYPAGNIDTTYDNFLKAVHPDDRQFVTDAINACVQHNAKYNIEHRVVWPNGTVRWLAERGDVVRDEGGKPLHMLGVVLDITERKVTEEALRLSEASLANAQRIARIGNWDLDLITGSLYWSDEIYRIFGRDPNSFTPSYDNFFSTVHPDDIALVRASEKLAMQDGRHDVVHRVIWPGGEIRYVRELGEVSFGADGRPLRMTGTVQDVTALKQTELALIAAKEEAEKANRAKSEFLSSMSHELRTPLNAILGFAQLLEADGTLSLDQKDSIEEILKGGHHLLSLISEVLDLSKIEAGRVDLSIEAVGCAEVAAEAMSLVRPMADAHGIAFSADEQGCEGLVLRADRVRLKQVLINLLSNAVKYNREGGTVRLDAQAMGSGRVRISVHDTGPGILPARLGELFQPFSRLGAEASEIEGSGIGLLISRRLIEMMGGYIGVESTFGVGSVFWVELDAEYQPAHAAGAAAAGQAPPDAGLATGSTRTVLYVEDNPANLKLVSQMFAHQPGIRLHSVRSPQLALQYARDEDPDLILLDINMPGMNGYDVLAALRARPNARRVPVVAITANATSTDVARGRAAGFDEYLTKPIDVPRLLSVVDRLLRAVSAQS